ncbi:hypothetical protein MKEN_01041400 [Mycena kentingensis (nom. inval.)]|nr:hypothetical protein MKEN_01041400 [Mycena kentingensis (nom. inval.)]
MHLSSALAAGTDKILKLIADETAELQNKLRAAEERNAALEAQLAIGTGGLHGTLARVGIRCTGTPGRLCFGDEWGVVPALVGRELSVEEVMEALKAQRIAMKRIYNGGGR